MNPYNRNNQFAQQQAAGGAYQTGFAQPQAYSYPSMPSRHDQSTAAPQPEDHGGCRIPELLSRHGPQSSQGKANIHGGQMAYGQASNTPSQQPLGNYGTTHAAQPASQNPFSQPNSRLQQQSYQGEGIKPPHRFGIVAHPGSNSHVRS
jgi:hypothetical protein